MRNADGPVDPRVPCMDTTDFSYSSVVSNLVTKKKRLIVGGISLFSANISYNQFCRRKFRSETSDNMDS